MAITFSYADPTHLKYTNMEIIINTNGVHQIRRALDLIGRPVDADVIRALTAAIAGVEARAAITGEVYVIRPDGTSYDVTPAGYRVID